MTMHKKEEARTRSDNDIADDKSTVDECDPWNPPYPMYDSSIHSSYGEWNDHINALLKMTRATNIIIPDRIPQRANSKFYEIYSDLLPILKKDSVRRFQRFLVKHGKFMTYGFIIIPEAFNQMIVEDAVRCAEVALEGKAPELEGFRANPNCMNRYGYFPLHEAAERFSVDMIKLLLYHGAFTNLRTAGDLVIENLLPLHVAVEDTCLHKYLEDNLLPNQENPDYPAKKDANYIYKIIHLLCLPEMKIFLDTTRLLAEHTDCLVDEIWKYARAGKLLQTAVLLLAAQAHIRVGSSCKSNGNSSIDGFATIITRISRTLELGQNEKEQLDLEVLSSALLLVNIINHSGKALDSYIRTHKEVPHVKILERVSEILTVCGFSPTGEGICVENLNLCPYKWWPMRTDKLIKKHGNTVAPEEAVDTGHLYHTDKQASRHKLNKRREREYTWNNFFPYWRSVLAWQYPIKVYPAHARGEALHAYNFDRIHHSGSRSFHKVSVPGPSCNERSLGRRIPEVRSMHESRRLIGTVALRILKVLKKA